MKKLSVISLIFSLLFVFSCEDKVEKDKTSPTIFFRTFGETNNNVVGVSVQQTKDDGYIILGSEYDGKDKSFLLKTDPNGIQEWNKKYGDGFPSSVEQSIDGGYVFLKNVYNDGTLIKVDSLGNEQWNKSLNGKGESIRQTSDGGWIITGSKNGSKILLIKIGLYLEEIILVWLSLFMKNTFLKLKLLN